MAKVVSMLQKIAPDIIFIKGDSFYWSPKHKTVTYRTDSKDPACDWALLHETAHALLGHKSYHSDFKLLILEVEAWQKAQTLGEELGILIDEDHIQDCLDTYRDWLHQRSTCPRCSVVCLQTSTHEYCCHNCNALWRVSATRFGRPYRKLIISKQEPENTQKTSESVRFI